MATPHDTPIEALIDMKHRVWNVQAILKAQSSMVRELENKAGAQEDAIGSDASAQIRSVAEVACDELDRIADAITALEESHA